MSSLKKIILRIVDLKLDKLQMFVNICYGMFTVEISICSFTVIKRGFQRRADLVYQPYSHWLGTHRLPGSSPRNDTVGGVAPCKNYFTGKKKNTALTVGLKTKCRISLLGKAQIYNTTCGAEMRTNLFLYVKKLLCRDNFSSYN